MVATYATLAQAKNELKAQSNTDDDKLMSHLFAASGRVDGLFESRYRYFMPWVRTVTLQVDPRKVDSRVNIIELPVPLLALTSITYNGAAMTVGSNVEAYVPGMTPYRQLRLMSTVYSWHNWGGYNSSYPVPLLSITGIWGYHGDYANAWLEVDSVQDVSLNASVTSVTVADVDGDDAFGISPRISRGALVKVGDEFMEVVNTNTTTNVVTVRRGAHGSTAATHAQNDKVYVWQPEENVRRVTARQAALMYARVGAFEVSTLNEIGVSTTYPQDLLIELRGALQNYVYG